MVTIHTFVVDWVCQHDKAVVFFGVDALEHINVVRTFINTFRKRVRNMLFHSAIIMFVPIKIAGLVLFIESNSTSCSLPSLAKYTSLGKALS